MQGSIDESEEEKPRPTPRTLAVQKEKHKRDKDLMNYTDSCSDSDEDHTPLSTYRSRVSLRKFNNSLYNKTCFARPLVFSTENGRKRQVALPRRDKINIKYKEVHEIQSS